MKKKYCLIALIVLCSLFSLSSCKKTEGSASPLTAITNLFKSGEEKKATPSNGTPAVSGPAVTVEKPVAPAANAQKPAQASEPVKSEEAPSKATALLAETKAQETPASVVENTPVFPQDEPVLVSVLYRGGSYLIHGEFQETEATVLCRNMTADDINEMLTGLTMVYPGIVDIFRYELDGDTLLLSYDKMTEGEIRAYWNTLISYMDAFNARKSALNKTVVTYETAFGPVSAEIYPLEARISVPDGITEEDVVVFLNDLAQENPEVIDFCTYLYLNGTILLSFAESVEEETALFYWEKITDALLPYGAAPFTMEAPQLETKVEEKNTEPTPSPATTTESTRISEPLAPVVAPAVAKTKTASYIKEKSFSVSSSMGYNIKGDFEFALQGRGEVRLTDNISVGVKTGYQAKSSLPLVVYGKMELVDNIYAFAGMGYRFGLAGEKGGLLLELGAGYEWEITDELHVFAEGGLTYDSGKNGIGIKATVGGRYTFL